MADLSAHLPKDLYQPGMSEQNPDAPGVLIVTGNNVEDLEFFYPFYRFIEAGCRVVVVTPDGGAFKGKTGLELKDSKKLTDVTPSDFHMLYLPGGKAPAELMKNHDALNLVKFFVKSGKLVSAVCHGPQLLAAADVIRGRRIAAWPECQKEIENAGATYVNEMTVTDGPFITARWPADLPSHLKETLAALAQFVHSDSIAGIRVA